jgi:hypothetical protein
MPDIATPPNRIERWKKMWGTPKRLDAAETDAEFEAFQDAFVPSHMHKIFLKTFGVPKAAFNNRFFVDEAVFRSWDTKLSTLLRSDIGHAEVTVIYGSPTHLEANRLRGEMRRSLRDVFIDDWHCACAIVRGGHATVYLFIQPKSRGCIVRVIKDDGTANDPEE